MTVRAVRDLTDGGDTAAWLVRLLVLLGLRERADTVHIDREGDSAASSLQWGDQFEELVPPPPHLVGEVVRVLAGLRPARERWANWWRGESRAGVSQAFEGSCPLAVGTAVGSLGFSGLPHAGGVLVALRPDCGPAGCEQAAAVLAGWWRACENG